MPPSHGASGRRFLAPEVVQTSAMDCGPASLKCLLEGFGIPVAYGRLREACQTDVDGTSIDRLEEVAVQLGLDAEQILVPADHLLLRSSGALPGLLVVRLPSGAAHFVVVWRRLGPWVQVMDPGVGRRWVSEERFFEEVYIHLMNVPARVWRGWAGYEEFTGPLRERLARLGVGERESREYVDSALAQPGWRPIAELDAAVRMVDGLVRNGGLGGGAPAARMLASVLAEVRQEGRDPFELIPRLYWTAKPVAPSVEGEEQILLRGALMVRVRGVRQEAGGREGEEVPPPLSRELRAALEEPPVHPARQLWEVLRGGSRPVLGAVAVGLLVAAAGVGLEALLLRGMFELTRVLELPVQRLMGLGLLGVFTLGLMLVELPVTLEGRRLGRSLELLLRISFLRKLPQLGDRYFQSRLSSDMAHRSHDVYRLRMLPELGERLLRAGGELIATTVGLLWLVPQSAVPVVLLAVGVVVVPLAALPFLVQADMRLRTHAGALARFYLDGLLGMTAIRTHGAERSVRREHEGLLVRWMEAGRRFHAQSMALEGLGSLVGFGLAAWLLVGHLSRTEDVGVVLLLVYWALVLPVLGRELAAVAMEYPAQRNTALRLLEPLGAPDAPDAKQAAPPEHSSGEPASPRGVALRFEDVAVRVSGHLVLEGLRLEIGPGEHVAVVGVSGAGKSTLAGLLLGWYAAAEGRVRVDGEPLVGARIEWLRQRTAWVDPATQLWNRSFLENLDYGAPGQAGAAHVDVLSQADLLGLLESLPQGMQTPLGEGGALVSGGEGQRVRFGRALSRVGARLVILDEPFRGLDRERRRVLLARARELWREATLLCITHDVQETQDFPRVLVIEEGRILEDGVPGRLGTEDTRYRALVEAEAAVQERLWRGVGWRRMWLADGTLREREEHPEPAERRRAS